MSDNYVGLTIRKEVLAKDGKSIDLEILKKIATAVMKEYCRLTGRSCPRVTVQRRLPNLPVEEYDVKPDSDLRIRLSLEAENYAPLNCWMEVDRPGSEEWALLVKLALYLSKQFPGVTFNVASSLFSHPDCTGQEKYTNLFRNGEPVAQLTRQEWVDKYLMPFKP